MSRFSQHGTLRRVLKCQVNYDKLWDQAPNKKESFITSHTEIHVVLHSQWFFCFVSPMLLTSPHISSPREMKKKTGGATKSLNPFWVHFLRGERKKILYYKQTRSPFSWHKPKIPKPQTKCLLFTNFLGFSRSKMASRSREPRCNG